ncbi:MAG: cupredoxin domain-containing protein [Phycisphaerae bacterium]
MHPSKTITFLTLALAAAAATRVTSSAPPATQSAPATHIVTIDNFTFSPQSLTISTGDTVTWINHDDVPHTATSAASPPAFNSKTLDTDEKFSFTFRSPGTFPYFCAVHPHMTATILVK